MNNMHHAEAVRLSVRPAFGRKKSIPSKYVPLYPKNSERELKALTNAYVRILKRRSTTIFLKSWRHTRDPAAQIQGKMVSST